MQALVMALSVALVVTGQSKTSDVVPKRGDAVSVRGCITGGTIQSSETEMQDLSGTYPGFITYRIAGNRKLVNPIKKEHDGHADVLTGTLKSDLLARDGRQEKRVGKTRITIGVGQPPRPGSLAQEPLPVLDVTAIEHTGATCRA
ncbi:MAG TPA: hypothetical protein VNJ03_04405 [Vicinamibacterales bacterium]|nr:hypothetical protein [Vicinamibacterales bacterium]